MLLRRIIEHLRAQEWTAIAIDFVIVVVGVFVGLQVSNWNEARAERERSHEYLSRIRAELVVDTTELERHREFWQLVANEGYTAIRYAETGDRDGATDWELLRSFLHASQSWQFTFVDTTYSELRSAGELRLIPDAGLRTELADYYVSVAARRGGLGPYHLLPEYREMVRGRVRSDIMRYYWQACFEQGPGVQIFVDCPAPDDAAGVAEALRQLTADRELMNALRYWADTQRMAVELGGFDLDRARSIIDLVDGAI
ncbi:MAG: hypothetical protein R3C31_14085 [Hyphomonadaceae bacterium]